MSVRINDIAPDFTADSTAGTLHFHEWLGNSYAIIFSHPRDFTPVCTTEFGAVAQLAPEFAKRNTKVMGVSVDRVEDHQKWKRDIEAFAGAPMPMTFLPALRSSYTRSKRASRFASTRRAYSAWVAAS